MEANPGTVEHGRFAGYAKAGINRVSLGAQTFDAAALATLGRIHGPGEIGAAVSELVDAGLDNFNLDLMYALPRADARWRPLRPRGRARARPRAPFALPADARAGHCIPQAPAAPAGRRTRLRHAAGRRCAPGARGLRAVRSLRLRAARAAMPAQPQLLALRRLPRHRRRRARQGDGGRRRHPHRKAALAPRLSRGTAAASARSGAGWPPSSCLSSSC